MLFLENVLLFIHDLTQLLQRICYRFYWLDLLYDKCNTINELKRRQTLCLLSIKNYFDIYFDNFDTLLIILITLSALSFILISILSLFEYITYFSSLCMEQINLFDFISLNFQVSSLFRLFMISFKYGLTLLRYYSTGSASFWSPLLSYST